MARGLRAGWFRAVLVAGAISATSMVVAGCSSQNAQVLARQACTYVNRSITLYQSSLTAKTEKERNALLNQAYNELSLALQPAALATGDNNQWQALMATISESSRVPESVLVNALEQQCAVADGQSAPPDPGNTPTTATTVPSTPAT